MMSFAITSIILTVLILAWLRFRKREKPKKALTRNWASVINDIEPVDPNFNWETCEPLKLRPFIGKRDFNPSMGVRDMTMNKHDWLRIEKDYAENMKIKNDLCQNRPDDMMFAHNDDKTNLALKEFYVMVVRFFTQRYPTLFPVKNGDVFNTILNLSCPVSPDGQTNYELMVNLNKLLDEDYLILLKDNEEDEEFVLRVSVNAAPAGFDPKRGHNMPVSHIHSPVPQYRERLKMSMSKFFANMLPKKLWVRTNWSIQTHATRFNLNSLHGREGDVMRPLTRDELDIDNCRLRVERQIFTRLPQSKGMIMIIRTYLTPIAEIKAEGHADELVYGIESLPDDLAFYKRRNEWGDAIVVYLKEKAEV
ncbi:hypothetical protein DIURU_001932 [Diutina rugosa]|uniref:Uncharacterized protein n=1 Tax=Diutina rugosa TaxID=5481 RepID=A0A642USJ8_DIURU|nr:uncharacterized protein DIURU_001932 [Diutina rugosa]KAA8904351.1 hypothetical protein DIURU_001932 [Diutina rugosa]